MWGLRDEDGRPGAFYDLGECSGSQGKRAWGFADLNYRRAPGIGVQYSSSEVNSFLIIPAGLLVA